MSLKVESAPGFMGAIQCSALKASEQRSESRMQRRREIPLCAGRPSRRSERGTKSRPAPHGMTVGGEYRGTRRGGCPYKGIMDLGFDLAGGGVPSDCGVAEVGFVGHVAGQRGVVAEDGVFGDLLMISHALEKSPEVGFFLVPGSAAIAESLPDGFLAGLGIVLLVPLLEIGLAHGLRIAGSVVAWRFVFTGLRVVIDVEFRDFQDSLGALEAVGLRSIATEIQPHVNRHASVVEERGVNVGHVAFFRKTENTTESHGALG